MLTSAGEEGHSPLFTCTPSSVLLLLLLLLSRQANGAWAVLRGGKLPREGSTQEAELSELSTQLVSPVGSKEKPEPKA